MIPQGDGTAKGTRLHLGKAQIQVRLRLGVGGSIYQQMLPYCDKAYITKVHVTPESNTDFPNLDQDSDWYPAEILRQGEENGIGYEMVLYLRK